MDKINERINIRPFRARDAATCFKIRSTAFIKEFYRELGARATASGVNAFMPDDYVHLAQEIPFFVAEDASCIIGFFSIQRRDSLVAKIPMIYINLNQLGKKIGQTMIEYIEQWVKANWPEVTTLIVDTVIPKYNSGFYKKVGFIPAGDAICNFPDMQLTALRLEKKI
jgi:GNAT superfamily N-acetyltransferase